MVPESVQRLRDGLELESASAALHHDLALYFLKLGDPTNAAPQLDLAVGSLPNRKDEERTELLELRSTVLIGTQPPAAATLDPYSQAIDGSKLAAQRDIALAITGNQTPAD